jgi:peptidoglycan-associated lipoprotein
MVLNKWTKIVLIGVSVLALTACKTTPKNGSDDSIANAYGTRNTNLAEDSARTSGLGSESSFQGQQLASNDASEAAKRVYYFDFDKDIVHDEYKPAIAANANYLVAHRATNVLVEGHTDPRGSREYNIALGERRANSVVKELTNKGVDPNQVRVVSYGSQKLASAEHTEVEFQKDRRAVLVYAQN